MSLLLGAQPERSTAREALSYLFYQRCDTSGPPHTVILWLSAAKSFLHIAQERSTAQEVPLCVFYQRCNASGRLLTTVCRCSEEDVTSQTVSRAVDRS